MFSFLRKETCPVELYGKLPLAKDYLRLGCGTGAGLALRDWLDRAFSGEVGADTAPVLAGPLAFVTGDALGAPLVGRLWTSSDAGGLRKFPFTLLVERRRKALAEDFAHGLELCGAIWERLDELRREHETSPDGQRFLARLRGVELDLDALAPRRSAGIDFDAWRRALWPSDPERGFELALDELCELAASRARTLRLPLAVGLPQREQAFAWARLTAALGPAQDELATMFFSATTPTADALENESAFVLLVRGPLAVGDARWLESPRVDALERGDLCAGGARRLDAASPAAETSTSLADSLHGAWTSKRARAGRGPR